MNKKITWILIVAAIVIVAILGFGKQTGNRQNPQQLKIGVIAPLSGDFGAVGENFVNGIKTAKVAYEKKTGNTVTLVIENDGGEAVKGLSAYKKLTEVDKVDGMINTFTTTMEAIYTPSQTLPYPIMMGFFQANNSVDDNVFQISLRNDGVWNKYADYLQKTDFDKSNMIIVRSIDAAQESMAKDFEKNYKGNATEIVASSNKSGLKSDATKIASMKPSAIIFFMTPENGAVLTKDLLPLIAKNTQLIYDVQINTGIKYYQDQLGDLSKINGAITIVPEAEPNQKFVAEYKATIGTEPGFTSDFGYDAFTVYMENYNKDKGTWIANIKKTDEIGASGHIKFDSNGVVIPNLTIKKVVSGKMEVVERLPFN
jgi:ABC-type branched-subunit amino acid transport system substrate-binding protein